MRVPLFLLATLLVLNIHGAGVTNAVSAQGATLLQNPTTGALTLRTPNGETVQLATKGFVSELKFHAEGALQWLPVPLPDKTEAACASFGVDDSQGGVRFIAVLLLRSPGGKWNPAQEWLAECGPLGEMSFKREKQSFSTPAAGTLLRKARKYKSEGHTFKLDCGCNVCQSATFDYMENETWTWNAAKQTFERKLFERAYIVQFGEGLMAVARKALGDARLISRLYRMNPELQAGGMLKEGQQIVFERILEKPEAAPASALP